MKRTALAFVILLFVAVAGKQLLNSAKADPFMPSGSWSDEPIPPSIDIQSPSETLNYSTGSHVWLNFTVTKPSTSWYCADRNPYPDRYAATFGDVTQVRFSLDRKSEKTTDKISEYQGVQFFSVELGSLSVGRHIITIYAEGLARYGNLTHDIFVGSQYSFKDSTKTKLVETSIDISFVVTDTNPVEVPLEEQPNEKDELPLEQPDGEDELTTSTTEPFPTSIVTASIIIVIVIGAGLLVYFKKHKR